MRRVVVLCLTLLFVAACGGGGKSTSTSGSGAAAPTSTSATSTMTTAATATSATATTSASPVTHMTASPNASPSTGSTGAGLPTSDQLQSGLLVLADFPSGWSVSNSDDSSASDTSGGSCGATSTPTPSDEVKATVDFQQTDLGPFVSEDITALPAGEMNAAWDQLKQSLSCDQWTETDSEGTPTAYQSTQLSLPKMGDDSIAVHITGTTSGFSFQADTVFVRIGNYVVSIANVALDQTDSNLTASITQKAVERVQAFTH